jgi:hypothetical protein
MSISFKICIGALILYLLLFLPWIHCGEIVSAWTLDNNLVGHNKNSPRIILGHTQIGDPESSMFNKFLLVINKEKMLPSHMCYHLPTNFTFCITYVYIFISLCFM